MFSRCVSWFICTFVAAYIATGYSDQDFISGSDSEVAVDNLRNGNPEEPVPEAEPSTAVDLGALLDAGEGAVVSLVSGDTRLVAHRAVLSARSAVFQRILQDAATGEVAVPAVEGPVLRQLVAHLYTLQAPQLPAVAPQLLAAAHQYGLPALKADCEQQVAAQLSVETAAATAVLAVRHCYERLRKAAIAYIRDHIFHVMGTQGWEDAIKNQPDVWIKVVRLLSESPAGTSSPATACQGPATDVPTMASQSTPQTVDGYISVLRNLSTEEKSRRLREAAKAGALRELDALLAAGADVEAMDEGARSRSALHWAAMEGHVEIVRRLLAAGAAVDARERGQRTPLHWAAFRGHTSVVQLLLAANADHSARDIFGNTPLHFAAANGRAEAAAALLAAGADRGAKDGQGWTPLDDARRNNQQQLVELLQRDSALTEAT